MKDELQFMPVGTVKRRGEIDTRDFRTTEIKNHGKKLGTTRWNMRLLIFLLTGSLALGGAGLAFSGRGSTKTTTPTTTSGQLIPGSTEAPKPVQVEKRVVVDYKVTSGDTLNGIIYKYASNANEMESIRNDVCFYNGIETNTNLQVGQIITLVRVPESLAEELNTGYNDSIDMNDELSETLNAAIEELNSQMGSVSIGSLLDTVNKELSVYNSTTNKNTRSRLARMLNQQISQVQQYDLGESQGRSK